MRGESEELSSPRSLLAPAGMRRIELIISEALRLSFRDLSSVDRARVAFVSNDTSPSECMIADRRWPLRSEVMGRRMDHTRLYSRNPLPTK